MAEPADLSDYSVHELLQRMEMKSRGHKAGPFAETDLSERLHHAVDGTPSSHVPVGIV